MSSALEVIRAAAPLFPGYAREEIRAQVLDPYERGAKRGTLSSEVEARVFASHNHSSQPTRQPIAGEIRVRVDISDLARDPANALRLAQVRALGALLERVQHLAAFRQTCGG